MVGRLAGDEFVIVLEDLDAAGERQVRTVATAVLERVQAIQEVQGVAISLTTSIGVAIHRPQDEETPQELLHRADTAMYRAKAAGKRQVAF
jgi:diguanylate cyclase (GGDEF)-like protein